MNIKKTAIAAPNIALIKYWGKKNDLLKLPINDSVSITLDEKVLRSKATLEILDEKGKDRIWLNEKKVDDEKIKEWISLVRKKLARKYPVVKNKIVIKSENNFPTSAGIASSASGFCALATALCSCLRIKSKKQISILARLGSGSASRSVYGGIVRWKSGKRKDGEDSFAVQVVPKKHWQLVDIIAIVDEGVKKISSKEGMERTMKTSGVMENRKKEAKKRILKIMGAIHNKNFDILAQETMDDSDFMHRAAARAKPPVIYMNDTSREIVYAIRKSNEKKIIAAYTFDAGANAHIIVEKRNLGKIRKMLAKIKGVKRIIISGIGNGSKIIEG
ncbi:MAG: diphosphomevalonate decarboxylase [Candidatus Micrarchaeia archaeon]